MNEQPPNILSAEWGWDNFREDAFQLIAWGYQMQEAKIRERHLEPDITGLIRQGIKEKVPGLEEALWLRFSKYKAYNEDPVDAVDKYGNERPRIDILIERLGTRMFVAYCFEAKRCARRNHTMAQYAEGILAFVTLQYAKDFPEGGVLGLMQSDDVNYWKQQLRKKLSDDVSLHCESSLDDIDVTPDLPDTTSSVHRRLDGSGILLVHAFVDCS